MQLTFFKLIALLPQNFLPLIAGGLSRMACVLARRDKRIIQENVVKVYRIPAISDFSMTFVRQVFANQILLALETIRYVFRPDDVLISGMEAAKALLEAASARSGVVIIAAHHGAWELAGHCAAKLLHKNFYALAKPSRSAWLTSALNELRRRLGMNVLWTDSKSLLKDMMAIVGRGDSLGFVMDQRPAKRSSGYPCTFLGVAGTQIVQGPALMAARKNLPVYGVHVMRVGLCRYHFFAAEVLPEGHGISDEHLIAQKMSDHLSQMILRYPEQWAWNYRRWR